MAMPPESRLAPLRINFLDDREEAAKTGCEKLDAKGASPMSDGSEAITAFWPDTDDEGKSNTSHGMNGASSWVGGSASDLVGEVDTYWPDTDDEWEDPSTSEHEMPTPIAQTSVLPPPARLPNNSLAAFEELAPKVVQGLGKALLQVIAKHQKSGALTLPSCFDYTRTPSRNIEEYVLHLYRACACSENCFVFALAYISKAAELNPTKVSVSSSTVHHLVLTATTVAAKYHDVDIRSNEFYAQAGCVEVEELNRLEASFLELLAWNLQVDNALFNRIRQLLIVSAP
eukprot:TRINITY_DN102082_c0_g1_i1.p1 TRINITY_DN102082_c0_g1~~TRINITY_DN102082_c0_g1_i1.p1  ORF type:complete len:306 (+),score=71.99 TRINITY_DN102082_c0_g1_i1:63-920(+)